MDESLPRVPVELPFDPDWVVHPGATLRAWREEKNLTAEQAAERCFLGPERYAQIESGDEEYGVAVAWRLERGTGISAAFWMNAEESFRKGLAAGKTWTR